MWTPLFWVSTKEAFFFPDPQEDMNPIVGIELWGVLVVFFFQAREQKFKICRGSLPRRFPRWNNPAPGLAHCTAPSVTVAQPHCNTAKSVSLSFPGGSASKASACNAWALRSILRLGRCSREENGNPLQYSHMGNPMDRGAWGVRAVVRVGHDLATKPPSPRVSAKGGNWWRWGEAQSNPPMFLPRHHLAKTPKQEDITLLGPWWHI